MLPQGAYGGGSPASCPSGGSDRAPAGLLTSDSLPGVVPAGAASPASTVSFPTPGASGGLRERDRGCAERGAAAAEQEQRAAGLAERREGRGEGARDGGDLPTRLPHPTATCQTPVEGVHRNCHTGSDLTPISDSQPQRLRAGGWVVGGRNVTDAVRDHLLPAWSLILTSNGHWLWALTLTTLAVGIRIPLGIWLSSQPQQLPVAGSSTG